MTTTAPTTATTTLATGTGLPAKPAKVAGKRVQARSIPYARELYKGTELQANPGIGPERFAAFALPSRVGNSLHYPDGRVEPMPRLRGEACAGGLKA